MAGKEEKLTKWSKFVGDWSLGKLESMGLEEYVKKKRADGYEKTFTYELQNGLKCFFGGNQQPFVERKWGIAPEGESKMAPGSVVNDGYVIKKGMGSTIEEAWPHLRERIVALVRTAAAGDVEGVEKLDFPLGDMVRWKLAFLYQPENAAVILPFYNRKWLAAGLEEMHPGTKTRGLSLAELHRGYGRPVSREELLERERFASDGKKKVVAATAAASSAKFPPGGKKKPERGVALPAALAVFLKQAQTRDQSHKKYAQRYGDLRVEVGFGIGKAAHIPWIGLPREGQTIQRGIYPAYLYVKKQQRLLLCFCIGEGKASATQWSEEVRAGHRLVREVVKAPPRYGDSLVFREYTVGSDSTLAESEEELRRDLDAIVAIYGQQFSVEFGQSALASFRSALEGAGFIFSPRLVPCYVAALCAKPFVILTGSSGTGKTKLAQFFAQWLDTRGAASADWKTYRERRWFKLGYVPGRITKDADWGSDMLQALQRTVLAECTVPLGWLDPLPEDKKNAEPIAKRLRGLRKGDIVAVYGGTKYLLLGIGSVKGPPFEDEDADPLLAKAGRWFIEVEWLWTGPRKIDGLLLPGQERRGLAVFQQTIHELPTKDVVIPLTDYLAKQSMLPPEEGEGCGTASRYELVPVGADWTDNRNVLGFVNHLKSVPATGRPVFQSTPVLDLVLRANQDRAHPYFLVLDEMNLSHVERYFSDFLSAMESRKPVPVHGEGDALQTAAGASVPGKLAIPANLFVIGTVNVDETTYMFSPKVLDRANVIEFRVEPDQVSAYLKGTSKGSATSQIAPAGDGTARGFLELSYKARGVAEDESASPAHWQSGLPKEAHDNCQETLAQLFDLLHRDRLGFAFRTMAEVLCYVNVDYSLATDPDTWLWQAAMDAQILQKILPKLHGSRKRLEPVLLALARYCVVGRLEDGTSVLTSGLAESAGAVKRVDRPAAKPGQLAPKDPVVFRESYEKLCDMLDAVRRDQFVSFIQ